MNFSGVLIWILVFASLVWLICDIYIDHKEHKKFTKYREELEEKIRLEDEHLRREKEIIDKIAKEEVRKSKFRNHWDYPS